MLAVQLGRLLRIDNMDIHQQKLIKLRELWSSPKSSRVLKVKLVFADVDAELPLTFNDKDPPVYFENNLANCMVNQPTLIQGFIGLTHLCWTRP